MVVAILEHAPAYVLVVFTTTVTGVGVVLLVVFTV